MAVLSLARRASGVLKPEDKNHMVRYKKSKEKQNFAEILLYTFVINPIKPSFCGILDFNVLQVETDVTRFLKTYN